MTAAVIPFAFEDNLVRVIKPNGEPWFVGKDVCNVLSIKDHNQALDRLDPDERGGYIVPTPQGDQNAICVSEPGVYRLIFTSRKPEAERFKRWLAHEVLPTLHKTGSYSVPGAETEALTAPNAEDGPVAALNAKLGVIREARLLFGADRARMLWPVLGLPDVPDPDASSLADARACLAHLVQQPIGEGAEPKTPFTIRHAIVSEMEDTGNWEYLLRENGIRVLPAEDGFVVAHAFTMQQRFGGTAWGRNQQWRIALRRLPGARKHGPVKFSGSTAHRGIFIPADALDDLPA